MGIVGSVQGMLVLGGIGAYGIGAGVRVGHRRDEVVGTTCADIRTSACCCGEKVKGSAVKPQGEAVISNINRSVVPVVEVKVEKLKAGLSRVREILVGYDYRDI
jgi:hypothetical protein